MPRRLPGFVPSHSGKITPLMPISSWAESKLFTPWKSRTNSEQQERNKWQGQIGPRVKMGCCGWNQLLKQTGPKGVSLGLSQVGPGPFWLGVKLGQGVKIGSNIIILFCTKTTETARINDNLTKEMPNLCHKTRLLWRRIETDIENVFYYDYWGIFHLPLFFSHLALWRKRSISSKRNCSCSARWPDDLKLYFNSERFNNCSPEPG